MQLTAGYSMNVYEVRPRKDKNAHPAGGVSVPAAHGGGLVGGGVKGPRYNYTFTFLKMPPSSFQL
jgi:hypothetical protein